MISKITIAGVGLFGVVAATIGPSDVAEQLTGQTKAWAEYGLPGLVILALFLGLGLVIYLFYRAVMSFVDAVDRGREDSAAHRQEHQQERKEWREASDRQTDKMESAFKDLTVAIHSKQL